MLKMEPSKPEHYRDIVTGERHLHDRAVGPTGATSITLFNGDEIVAIIGGVMIVPKVLSAFALVSDSVSKCPKEFHKTVKWMISFYMKEFELRRLQFIVRADFDRGITWAEKLGFHAEGLMRGFYADDGDAWLYAKVSKWAPSR